MVQKIVYIVIQIFIFGAVFLAGVKTRSLMTPSWQKKFANAKKIKPYKVGHVVDEPLEKEFEKIEYDVFVTRCVIEKTTTDPYITVYKIDTDTDTDGEDINLTANFANKDFKSLEFTKGLNCFSINHRGIYPQYLFRKEPNGDYVSFFDYGNANKKSDGIFDVMFKSKDEKRDKFIRLNSKWHKTEYKKSKYFINGIRYKFNKEQGCWAVCENNDK